MKSFLCALMIYWQTSQFYVLNKKAAEEIRKQEWLSRDLGGEIDHSRIPLCPRNADKYGLAWASVCGRVG